MAGFVALARAHEAALLRLAHGAGVFDLALGEGLLALAESGHVIRLGYARVTDYARERLGVPPSTAHSWMQLARELRDRPTLRRAVRTGLVSSGKALIVSRVAVGEDEAAWTAAAASLTRAVLKKRVRGAGGVTPREWNFETLRIRMSPGQQSRLTDAVRVARRLLGPDRPGWHFTEAVAMEWLGAHGEWTPDAPGPMERRDEDPAEREEWLALWTARSTEVLRQLESLDLAGALLDDGGVVSKDVRALDERLCRLIEARRGSDVPLGRQAEIVSRLRVWRVLGYANFEEYCNERLGLAPRTVRQRIWLEQRMQEMPALRAALGSGRLTYSKALDVARGATAHDVEEWIATSAGTTSQQTARAADASEERQNVRMRVRRVWAPDDAMETIRLAITCAQAVSAARGRSIDRGEALAMMADHFVRVWEAEVERIRNGIRPGRLRVLVRTGGLCAVPGCSRAAEHEHHVRYRSRGGGEEEWNRVGLCDAHHLAGIHGGWMTVEGMAGDRLFWELGIENGAAREQWITEGDDDTRRIAPAG